MSDASMPCYNPGWSAQPNIPAPEQPKQIRWAFWLLMTAAVLAVVTAVFRGFYYSTDAFRQTMVDQMANRNASTGQDMVNVGVGFAVGAAIALAVVGVILYVLIGLFIKRGAGWARITGLVLAVISLTQLSGLAAPGGIFAGLQVLAGIAAIVFCFTSPGKQFFTDTKNFKAANKTR